MRPVDVSLIASLEMEAENRGVNLLDVMEALTAATWDPDLHPRGKDGKFIELLGLVKLVGLSFNGKDGKMKSVEGRRGKVMAINPDPKNPGKPKIRVALLDKDGKPSVVIDDVKPSQIVQAPEKARLDADAPGADVPKVRADSLKPGDRVRLDDGREGDVSGIVPVGSDDNPLDGPGIGVRDDDDNLITVLAENEKVEIVGETFEGAPIDDAPEMFEGAPVDDVDMSSGPDWQQTGVDEEVSPAWMVGTDQSTLRSIADFFNENEGDAFDEIDFNDDEQYAEILEAYELDDGDMDTMFAIKDEADALGMDPAAYMGQALDGGTDFDRGDLEGKVPGGFDPAGDHVEQFRNGNPPSPTGSDDFGKSAATYLTDDELDEVIAIRQSEVDGTKPKTMSSTADLKILQDEKARRDGTLEPVKTDADTAADMVKKHALGTFDIDSLSDVEAQDMWETLLDVQDSPGDFPSFDGIPQDDVLALSDALQARYNVEGLEDADFAKAQGQKDTVPEWSIFAGNQKDIEVTRGATATFVDHPGLPDGVDFMWRDEEEGWLRRDRNVMGDGDRTPVTDKDLLWELDRAKDGPEGASKNFTKATSPVVMETGFRLQQQNAVDDIRDTFSADQFAGDLADEYAAFDQALLDYRDTMTGGRLDEVNAAKKNLVDRYYDVQDAAEWDEIDEDVTDTFQEMFESDLFEGNLGAFSAPVDEGAGIPDDVTDGGGGRGVGYDVKSQVDQIPDDVSPEIRDIWTRSAIGTAVKNATDPLEFEPNDMSNPNVVARANLSLVNWDGDYNKQLDEISEMADDPALLQVISDARDTADRLLGKLDGDNTPESPAVAEARAKATPESFGGRVAVFDDTGEPTYDADKPFTVWVTNEDGSKNGGRGSFATREEAEAYAAETNRLTDLIEGKGDKFDMDDDAAVARILELDAEHGGKVGYPDLRGFEGQERDEFAELRGWSQGHRDLYDRAMDEKLAGMTDSETGPLTVDARELVANEIFDGYDVRALSEGKGILSEEKFNANFDKGYYGELPESDRVPLREALIERAKKLDADFTAQDDEIGKNVLDKARAEAVSFDDAKKGSIVIVNDGGVEKPFKVTSKRGGKLYGATTWPDQTFWEDGARPEDVVSPSTGDGADAPEPEPQAVPDAQVTGPDTGFEGSTVKLLDGGDATPGSKVTSVKDGKTYTIEGVYNNDKLKPDTYVRLRDEDGKLSYKSKRTLKAASADTPAAEPDVPEASAPGGEPDVPLAEAPSAPDQSDAAELANLQAQLADLDKELGGKWGDQFGNMGAGTAYRLKKLQADRKSVNEKIRILEAKERQAALDKKKQPRPADWKPKKIDDPEILKLVKQTDAALWENSQEYDNPYYSTKDLLDVRRDQVGEEIAFARQFVGESNDQYITLKVPSGSEESIPLEVAEAYAAQEGIKIPAAPSI